MKMLKMPLLTLGITLVGICSPLHVAAQSQSWSQALSVKRFQILTTFNSEAVLDKETGLVWEETPHAQETSWAAAQLYCTRLTLGNRRGWRLPAIQELESLIDASVAGVALPAGHPFGAVDPNFYYWSATGDAFDASRIWVMTFADGSTTRSIRCAPGSGCGAPIIPISVWCVRGGPGTDAQ